MSETNPDETPQSTFSKLLPWIVLLLSALGLFYFVDKGCGAGQVPAENKTDKPVDSTQMKPLPADTLHQDSIH